MRHPRHDIEDAQHHGHALCDHGSHSGTGHAHAHPGNEPQVQHHVQRRAEQQEHQRHHTVADGPQQARAQVVSEHDDDAQINDDDVAVGIFQDFGGGVQQLQQGPQAEKARRGDGQRRHQSDDQRPGHRALEQVLVLSAVGARCHDGKAVADAKAEAHQKLVDGSAGANGSKGGVAQHVAHDHGVHGVVQLLEQVGNENGQHEQHQTPENGAVHQVYIHLEEVLLPGLGLGHRVPPTLFLPQNKGPPGKQSLVLSFYAVAFYEEAARGGPSREKAVRAARRPL